MDLQKEREAFEKECKLLCYKGNMVMSNLGNFYNNEQTNWMWQMWLSSKAQAVLEVKPSRHVTLTCAQLREAFMFGAPDKDDQEQLETEMTITWSENGHSGKGYYCYYSDLPEEGAIFLDDVIEAQEMDLNAYVYDFANAIEREAKAQAVPNTQALHDRLLVKSIREHVESHISEISVNDLFDKGWLAAMKCIQNNIDMLEAQEPAND